MMKFSTLLLSAALLLGAQTALAERTTYVFPYEGFRYTQQEDETVLTQTNLGQHDALITALGTTQDAILASYIASGIVMEVIPDEGGQIAVSVVDAGDFADVQSMDELSEADMARFVSRFEDSGLYESCGVVQTTPLCVRLTASAMYGSMPVYTLRYATLHLGQLYLFTQTIVGRAPEAQDDEQMERMLSGVTLLAARSEATATPTPAPTATPTPTPTPTPGVAQVLASEGEVTVEGVPAFTSTASVAVSGTAGASQTVRVRVGEKTLGSTTAKKDGSFSLSVTLPQEGDVELTVETEDAQATLAVRYEMATAALAVTEPESTTFTGSSVTMRGITEPGASVTVTGGGVNRSVKADKTGVFSVRISMDSAGTQTYTLSAQAEGFKDSTTTLTLTRELTEKEGIALFRKKMIALTYTELAKAPLKYEGKQFIFRGKVFDFTDFEGTPCALVCVNNVSTGVWRDPIWVVLDSTADVQEGDVLTFYLVGESLTLPADAQYTGADQGDVDAPVARAMYWTSSK